MIIYCFDTSAFIGAWERTYPPDVAPSFWARLDDLVQQGRAVAPEEVKTELVKKADAVWSWARDRQAMFVPIDGATQAALREVLARFPAMLKNGQRRNAADPWVVALAKVRSLTVVTTEGPISGENNPKIPLVCGTFGVKSMNLIDFIRAEGWRF